MQFGSAPPTRARGGAMTSPPQRQGPEEDAGIPPALALRAHPTGARGGAMTSPHERQGQQEHAAIAAAFDADPVDWVLEWALDDWGQAWLFASQMWEYGLEAPPVPRPDVDAMVDRITPDVLADLRLHGFVSNRAACRVRYVWTGTRCRCEHQHGGMDFPSDDQWPAVIQPPDRRRATFECADGHVTTLT